MPNLNSVTAPECDGVKKVDIEKVRKEVLYRGYFYDVTDFIHKHPGGTVIQFYTDNVEDATQAIEQFHFRAAKKVELIMKTFKRRPATPEQINPDRKSFTRHEAMTSDFRKLFEELQAEGYFKPSIRQIVLRFLEAISLTIMSLGLMDVPQPIYTKFLCVMLAGLAYSRFGWIQHEGGHRSLTGRRKIDQFLQDVALCFFPGGSSVWWNSQHNRHHAMPQRLQHDVDLAALPFVAFNEREIESKNQFVSFFMKYQGFLYWTVDMFLAVIAWKFYLHPRCQLRKKAYFEILLNIPSYYVLYHVGFFWFFIAGYWMAFFLGLNFALSHSHLDATDKPTHWIEYSFTHTANIQPSMWCDWWMGYLNYQIEHHLFPTMPQFRQREICDRVQALAEKHNLPYLVYSYPEASWLAMKNLFDVGKSVSKKDWDVKN